MWLAMATLTLQPPAPFNFAKPDEWPKWIKRFKQYRVASGLSKDSDTRQVKRIDNIKKDKRKTLIGAIELDHFLHFPIILMCGSIPKETKCLGE